MSKLLTAILFLAFILTALSPSQAQVVRKRSASLMGSRFDITIVASDSLQAEQYIDQVIQEVARIEQLISEWIPGSQVSEVNRNAGIRPVKVDRELFGLTQRALRFSDISGGAFDISIAAMDRIWKFDGSMEQLPDSATIRQAINHVGYQYIELDSAASTIYLKRTGMKIGFGATGKGYAADRGRELMRSLHVPAGIVNASGDIAAWGTQPDGSSWRIGVTHPYRSSRLAVVLSFKNGAVATSGDYEKYVEINGQRYAHIINPKTGMPGTGLTSATVVGPGAEAANGFSTSIMVLGKKEGLLLLKQYPEYACLLISSKGKITRSRNYKKVTRNLSR